MKKIRVAPTTAVAFLVGVGVATAGTATAAQMITGKQIKNGSITAKDLSKGLRKQLGVPGPVGPAGPSGPVGPAGPAGSVSTVVNRRFEMQGSITPPGQVGVLTGSCQSGERALSAGYTSGGTAADFVVHRSLPMKGNNVATAGAENPDGWAIVFTLTTGQSVYLNVLCAR